MTDDISSFSEYNDTHRSRNMLYANNTEKAAIIKDCGDSAVVLYGFYLAKSNDKRYKHTDKKTALTFGWSESKAQRVRLSLEKAGWYKAITSRNGNYSIISYFLGPIRVLQHKIETSKPKLSIASVVVLLDGLPIKYTEKQKHQILKRWLKAGYMGLSKPEQDAYTADRFEFINKIYLHT